jgi:ArsR family transcriptional regulator
MSRAAMDAQTWKLYEMKARIVQAAAHPLRLAIIEFLQDGEQCVCDIAEHVGARRPNVSRHLGLMLRAGVLEHRKDGLRMLYSLRTPCILNFLECVTNVLREHYEASAAVLEKL